MSCNVLPVLLLNIIFADWLPRRGKRADFLLSLTLVCDVCDGDASSSSWCLG